MTHLLVSDLDGTLLTGAKQVTPRTISAVNDFVARGGLFTIATARMAYGCAQLVAELDMRLPAVVMNGAALYRFDSRSYSQVQRLSADAIGAIAAVATDVGVGAYVLAITDGRLRLACARPEDLEWTQYNSARAREAVGRIPVIGFGSWAEQGHVAYLALVGPDDSLEAARLALSDREDLRGHSYRNVYSGHDCLEYSSASAGKGAAIARLRRDLGADQLVAFGDNRNDVDMMQLADLSFAPANGDPRALAVASGVMEANDDDGVARTIERHAEDWLPERR